MQTFIGLLRGINVGGRNKLPMADLREVFESAGLEDVRTYIQSGNIVFRTNKKASAYSAKIESKIESRFGFRPKSIMLPAADVREAAHDYPFPVTDHRFAHLMFLEKQPEKSAIERILAMDHDPDRIAFGKRVLFIYLPNGVSGARTDLSRIERILGVNCTTRNWRTVQKLLEMAS